MATKKNSKGGNRTPYGGLAKSAPSDKKSKKTSKVSVQVDKDSSIRVEQIENGFLVAESGTTGSGKNQKWYEKKYFSPTNPVSIQKPVMRFGSKKK